MKFSAVIPVYNVEKYIVECIESILNQTYQNFEIILVDDGSTDNSGKICDKYAQDYPDKVRVIHNINQGPLKARHVGIASATGDILLLIDSDDYIRKDAMELICRKFETGSCDMVLFNGSSEPDYCKAYPGFPFADGQRFSGETKKELYELMITSAKLNALWIKAARMEVVNAIPANYSEFGVRNAEDLLYSMPMLSASREIVFLDQNLYYYRDRSDSIVHTFKPGRHLSIKRVHKEMEKYIDIWRLPELHDKHFAREVKGWCESLMQLMSQRELADEHRKKLFLEMANDEYFLKAFAKMDVSCLSKKDLIISKWCYQKKYTKLRILGNIIRTVRNCKRVLMG